MPTQLEMVSPELPVTGYQVRESRYYEFKERPPWRAKQARPAFCQTATQGSPSGLGEGPESGKKNHPLLGKGNRKV